MGEKQPFELRVLVSERHCVHRQTVPQGQPAQWRANVTRDTFVDKKKKTFVQPCTYILECSVLFS